MKAGPPQTAIVRPGNADQRAVNLVAQHRVGMVEPVVGLRRILATQAGFGRGRKSLRRHHEGFDPLHAVGFRGVQVNTDKHVSAAAGRQHGATIQGQDPVVVAGHHHPDSGRRQMRFGPAGDIQRQVFFLQPWRAGARILAAVSGIQHDGARPAPAEIGRRPDQRVNQILRIGMAETPLAPQRDHRRVQPDPAAVVHHLPAVLRELKVDILPADDQRPAAWPGQRQPVHGGQVFEHDVLIVAMRHRAQGPHLSRRRKRRRQPQSQHKPQRQTDGMEGMHKGRHYKDRPGRWQQVHAWPSWLARPRFIDRPESNCRLPWLAI